MLKVTIGLGLQKYNEAECYMIALIRLYYYVVGI
jgi:hypothetical protein